MAKYPISAVIIADPQRALPDGTTANVQDSAAQHPGRLEQFIATCTPIFAQTLLVAAEPLRLLAWDHLIVRDHFQPTCILSGLHAGLFAAQHDQVFALGCDGPMLSPAIIDQLMCAMEPRWDAVVIEAEQGLQPLPAIYSKRCLKPLARQLAQGNTSAQAFLRQLHMRTIPAQVIQICDPAWVPIFNDQGDPRGL